MKLGKWDFPSTKKTKNERPKEISVFESGNPELAKNKEIYSVLSDPEFIKTFPGPADFQYDLIRESLISSKENAINGIAYLKDYIKTSDNPLFCLVRLSQFLHTALGNQKSLASSKEQKEISEILKKGFKDISSDDEIKYFLGVNFSPDIILKQIQSFEGQERGLTPIHLSEGYFIQDNGFDPIPIFYQTDNPEEFNLLIEEQKKFFKSARPENRPEMPKNPTLEEMIKYKNKYLDPIINFSEIKKEIREKINNRTNRLKPEEIQKFFPSSHNTFELTQDPMMFEFRAFINKEIRQALENDFGVDLKTIPLKEQIYFLTSITKRTNETIKPVQKFAKKFKALGLRTFLSIEQGGQEMGNKILELGEKLPEEVARMIYTKYSEIVDSVEEIKSVLQDRFGKENKDEEVFFVIKENLLKKGKDLLLESSSLLKNCQGEDCSNVGNELLVSLENIHKENILLASTYKALTKNEPIKIEDVRDVSIEKTNQKEELDKNREEMLRIFKDNRKNYPERLLKETVEEFENAMNDPKDKEFFILRNKKDILAFMRFDILPNGNYYAGSLNGRNEIHGLALGGSLLKELLVRKAKERNIEAVVYEKNQMLDRYLNEFGFKIIGEIENYKNTGQKFYQIFISKSV